MLKELTRIRPFIQNDTSNVIWNSKDDKHFYKVNKSVSLFDLGRDVSRIGYSPVDRVSLISGEGKLASVIIGLKNPHEPNSKFEYFELRSHVESNLQKDSTADRKGVYRVSNGHGHLLTLNSDIDSKTLQWDGSPSDIASGLRKAEFRVSVGFKVLLNSLSGEMTGWGKVDLTYISPSFIPDGPVNRMIYRDLISEVMAYSVELYFE